MATSNYYFKIREIINYLIETTKKIFISEYSKPITLLLTSKYIKDCVETFNDYLI